MSQEIVPPDCGQFPPQSRKKPLRSFLIGLVLTGTQLLLVRLSAPQEALALTYERLCNWDCRWYETIARDGYHSTIPPVAQNPAVSNVAFFPGYPWLGRTFHLVFGTEVDTSLILVAQIFAVVFWAALWTLLRRWRIPTATASLVVLAVLAHPAAFFLISGYSESLFLATLLLFILESHAGQIRFSFGAPIAGFFMSATRIIGLPVAGYPLVQRLSRAWVTGHWPAARELAAPLLNSVLASLGAVSFFIFCQFKFGHFDLYLKTQQVGWGIDPDYLAIFKWFDFDFRYSIDRVTTWASGAAFIGFLGLELGIPEQRRSYGLRLRLPLYLTAFLIFFMTLSGLKSVGFMSMIRYSLPWYILLLLCLAQLSLRAPRFSRPAASALFILLTLGLLSWLQFSELPALREFIHGRWFA